MKKKQGICIKQKIFFTFKAKISKKEQKINFYTFLNYSINTSLLLFLEKFYIIIKYIIFLIKNYFTKFFKYLNK